MNDLVLPVNAGTLPGGSCPATGDYQGLLNLFAAYMTVTFPSSFAGITVSSTPPDDQTQAWLALDGNGRPIRLYYYAAGAWVSYHPIVPGMVMMWPFPLPDFTTFDGGDTNPLSAVSGPMWQQAKDSTNALILQAQFPIGPGTTPVVPGAGGGTTIVQGQVGGEENHVLTTGELATHTHAYGLDPQVNTSPNYLQANTGSGFRLADVGNAATGNFFAGTGTQTGPAGSNTGHNNLPPFYGIYFIQRSSRLFYSA